MAQPAAQVAHHRARVAALSRDRAPDDHDLLDAKQQLRVAKTAEYIRKLVEEAPPLSDDQRARLAELLAPVRKGGGAA